MSDEAAALEGSDVRANLRRHGRCVMQSCISPCQASGCRDFTRIAASDPVMWRDIFLNNREALLEMLARFMEDAQAMSRAEPQQEIVADPSRRSAAGPEPGQ